MNTVLTDSGNCTVHYELALDVLNLSQLDELITLLFFLTSVVCMRRAWLTGRAELINFIILISIASINSLRVTLKM
jgi:hypothetical protein